MDGPDRLLDLIRRLIGRGRTWRGPQTYLCEQLGVPLRTLQRWTSKLRLENKIFTRRLIDARGYRNLNIYSIVDSRGGSSKGYLVGGSCSTTTYGRNTQTQRSTFGSSNQDQKPSKSERKAHIHMRKIAPIASQPALFEDDVLDVRPTSSDNDRNRKVSTQPKKGTTPAVRCVAYWLTGRSEKPPRHMIAAIGRVIRQCFEQNQDLTEREVYDAIDSLLLRGLDLSPRHYLAACGGKLKKPLPPRDYEQQPLRMRHRQRSMMRPGARTMPDLSLSPRTDGPSPSTPTSSTLCDTSLPSGVGPATPSTGASVVSQIHNPICPDRRFPADPQPFTIERIADRLPVNAAEEYQRDLHQMNRSLDWRPMAKGLNLAAVMASMGVMDDGGAGGPIDGNGRD